MKIKNKIFIALGTSIATITPVVTVVSCGSSNLSSEQIGRTPQEVAAYQAALKEWKTDWANYEWSENAIVNTHIAEGIFQNQDLRDVISVSGKHFWIPSFIQAIGDKAFANADLPNGFDLKQTPDGKPISLLKIGRYAFAGCDLSNEINGKPAFANFIPETVYSISDRAFDGAKLPSDFKIGKHIIDMQEGVLANTTLPAAFVFEPNISFIPDETFSGVTFKSTFKVPSNITTVGQYAFRDVKFIGGINLDLSSANIQNLSYGAFTSVAFDNTFELPLSVNLVAPGAFSGAIFKNGFAFAKGSKIKYITDQMFVGADLSNGLEWNGLPIRAIGGSAFESAKLKSDFTIPNTVRKLGTKALSQIDLTKLAAKDLVSSLNVLEEIGPDAFTGTKLPEDFVLPSKAISKNLLEEGVGLAFRSAVLPSGYFWSKIDSSGLPQPGATVTNIVQ